MKVQVKTSFIDKNTGNICESGCSLDINEERYKELLIAGCIFPVPDEKKQEKSMKKKG